jgi:hypothetical protein
MTNLTTSLIIINKKIVFFWYLVAKTHPSWAFVYILIIQLKWNNFKNGYKQKLLIFSSTPSNWWRFKVIVYQCIGSYESDISTFRKTQLLCRLPSTSTMRRIIPKTKLKKRIWKDITTRNYVLFHWSCPPN